MSTTKFESIIQRYFEKVYVSMLRKSIDYEDVNTLPNYILIDKKRESYYLAESDLNDSSTQSEIVELSKRVSKKVTDDKLANTIARLIYAYANFSLESASDNIVFDDLSKKASFIISDENMEAIKSVLDNLAIQYTPVFVKAGYIILFIDDNNFNSLIEFFLDDKLIEPSTKQENEDLDNNTDDENINEDFDDSSENEDNLDLDNLDLNNNDLDDDNDDDNDKNDGSLNTSDLDSLDLNSLDLDSLDNLDANPSSADNTTINNSGTNDLNLDDLGLENFDTSNTDSDSSGLDSLNDLDLDSLDLDELGLEGLEDLGTDTVTTSATTTATTSDIAQPSADVLANSTDDIFGSNTDTLNATTDRSTGLGSTDSIPFDDDLNNSLANLDELEELANLDDDYLFEVNTSEATAKTKVVETPVEEPVTKSKKPKIEKNKIKRDTQSYPISTFLAFIFMMPAFILDRITAGKLPPFVIYWFTMLTLFFGIYEIPTSHIVEDYYSILSPMINNNIIQMTDTSAIIVTSLSFTQSVEPKTAGELLSNPIISSVGFVASVSTFLYEYQFAELFGNLIILRYCLAFSVMLMITSFLRAFGFKLYCTFMLLFLTIPYIILLQSKILLVISDNMSFLIANPMANPPSGLFMIQSLISMLTVFVLPLLIILIYFGFFAIITPTKPKGVLP